VEVSLSPIGITAAVEFLLTLVGSNATV
jgi:hypothetical protein